MPTPIPVVVAGTLDRAARCPHCAKDVTLLGHAPDVSGTRRFLMWHGYEALLKCPECGKLSIAWKKGARLAIAVIYAPMTVFFAWMAAEGIQEGTRFAAETGGPIPTESILLGGIGTFAAIIVAWITWRMTRPVQKDGGRLAEVDGKLQWDYAAK